MFYGERLKKLRKEKGYTQGALAEMIDLDKTSICCYEKGLRTPTLETYLKLVEKLEVDPNYLLGVDTSMVAESDNNHYYINAAFEDIEIIKELKRHPELYKFINNDIKRSIEYLSKQI